MNYISSVLKIVKVGFSLCVVIFNISCRDFLQETPLDSVSEGVYWNDENDAFGALVGVYSSYADSYAERIQNLDKSMIWMSAYAGYASWRTFAWSRDVDIEPTHGTITIMWQKLFTQISRANYFLDNIEKVNMDENKRRVMSAEVRFLRSFSYFWLSQTYGNVPLIETTLTFEEANSVAQKNEKEIRTYILMELDDIIGDLPISRPDDEYGRIEKGAALALKGRIQLSEENWQEAANTYKTIMELNRYEIDPRFHDLFLESGENNDEFIFVNKYMAPNYGEAMSQNNIRSSLYGGYNACNIFHHFVEKFLMIDGETITSSKLYDPSKPFENRDPRLYATVLITGYSELFGEIFQGDPGTIERVGQTGANISGYLLNKFFDENFTGNRQQYGADYPQIRYAEILLSRLEAELEAGNIITQDLLDQTINKIRGRLAVDMPYVTETNHDKLRNIIRRERNIELAFEGGVYYFDLRRWNLLEQEVNRLVLGMKITDDPSNYDGKYNIDEDGYLIIGKLNFLPHNRLWPIPLNELDVNKNLFQNPGYK